MAKTISLELFEELLNDVLTAFPNCSSDSLNDIPKPLSSGNILNFLKDPAGKGYIIFRFELEKYQNENVTSEFHLSFYLNLDSENQISYIEIFPSLIHYDQANRNPHSPTHFECEQIIEHCKNETIAMFVIRNVWLFNEL